MREYRSADARVGIGGARGAYTPPAGSRRAPVDARTYFLLVDAKSLRCAMIVAHAAAVFTAVAEGTLRVLRSVEVRSNDVPATA